MLVVPEPASQSVVPPEPVQAPEPIPTPGVEIAGVTPESEPAPVPASAAVFPSQLRNERVEVRLLQPLGASTSRQGDQFRTEVVSPAGLRGATIESEITAAKAAGKVSGKSDLLSD